MSAWHSPSRSWPPVTDCPTSGTVFLSLADRDKAVGLAGRTAVRASWGSSIVATSGTAAHLGSRSRGERGGRQADTWPSGEPGGGDRLPRTAPTPGRGGAHLRRRGATGGEQPAGVVGPRADGRTSAALPRRPTTCPCSPPRPLRWPPRTASPSSAHRPIGAIPAGLPPAGEPAPGSTNLGPSRRTRILASPAVPQDLLRPRWTRACGSGRWSSPAR